jgi:hypothetical protein
LGRVVDEVEDVEMVEKDIVCDREQRTIATLSRAFAPRYVGFGFCIPVRYMIVCWVCDSRKRKASLQIRYLATGIISSTLYTFFDRLDLQRKHTTVIARDSEIATMKP